MNPGNESNLALLFRARSSQYADAIRWRQWCGESWRTITFAQQRQLVNQVISGLDALGAHPGDAIGILSGTRWEWIVADWAIMGLGGVTIALYPSLPRETVAFMLRNSATRYRFIEDESQYAKLHDVLDNLPLIEGLLKEDPLVSQACVYGDRKPYLVALLTLDWPTATRWAEQRHILIPYPDDNPRELTSSPALREHLEAHVKQVNAHLARFEQVKYFDVLTDEFTVQNGLLTPTQKIRRKPVNDRYRARFEALYPLPVPFKA